MRKIKEIIKRYEIDQLLTCLFISALLIFGALYLIFLVSPNSAYISYEATNVNSIFNITAKEIRGVLATEVFTFCDFDELEFYPTNDASYFVDGIEYTSDDVSYLRVLPEPDVVISDNGEEYIIESEVTYYMKEHTKF